MPKRKGLNIVLHYIMYNVHGHYKSKYTEDKAGDCDITINKSSKNDLANFLISDNLYFVEYPSHSQSVTGKTSLSSSC